ncbi:MAG: Thivi_2564 family membrane protein [Candidatus Cybelea sp.]
MPLIEIVVVLIVVGVLLWLVNTYIPMAAPIKSLLNAVVVIVMVVWILKVFGLWHYITHIRAG